MKNCINVKTTRCPNDYLGTKIQKIFVFLLCFWLTYQVILAKLCLLRLFVGVYCGLPLTHCFVPNWGPNGSLFIIWPVSRLPTSLSSKLRSSSLHLLAPKVRQKLLSLLLETTDRRSKKSFLLYGKIKESCSIKTITPSIVLRLLEGLQRTFDYVYINTYQAITL